MELEPVRRQNRLLLTKIKLTLSSLLKLPVVYSPEN